MAQTSDWDDVTILFCFVSTISFSCDSLDSRAHSLINHHYTNSTTQHNAYGRNFKLQTRYRKKLNRRSRVNVIHSVMQCRNSYWIFFWCKYHPTLEKLAQINQVTCPKAINSNEYILIEMKCAGYFFRWISPHGWTYLIELKFFDLRPPRNFVSNWMCHRNRIKLIFLSTGGFIQLISRIQICLWDCFPPPLPNKLWKFECTFFFIYWIFISFSYFHSHIFFRTMNDRTTTG